MKKMIGVVLSAIYAIAVAACGNEPPAPSGQNSSTSQYGKIQQAAPDTDAAETSDKTEGAKEDAMDEKTMYISVNGTTFTASLADNSSADALRELLRSGDIVIDAHDFSSFEKVGALPQSLPRNDEQITTGAGDLILYQGNQFVLYYDTNSWSFTRLGKIENVTTKDLLSVLGDGDVEITLSLSGGKGSDAV